MILVVRKISIASTLSDIYCTVPSKKSSNYTSLTLGL